MGQPFPGPWSFKYHPWIREMHDATEEMIVGQKGAQLAFTECVLNKAFFNIDVKGVSVLYVLPANTPDASDFSKARFDPALELSPHLSSYLVMLRISDTNEQGQLISISEEVEVDRNLNQFLLALLFSMKLTRCNRQMYH